MSTILSVEQTVCTASLASSVSFPSWGPSSIETTTIAGPASVAGAVAGAGAGAGAGADAAAAAAAAAAATATATATATAAGIMVVRYQAIAQVMETWEAARQCSSHFEADLSTSLWKRFLEAQPPQTETSGVSTVMLPPPPLPQYHSDAIVYVLDSVLYMLASAHDGEFAAEILKQVGERHGPLLTMDGQNDNDDDDNVVVVVAMEALLLDCFTLLGNCIWGALKQLLMQASSSSDSSAVVLSAGHRESWDEVYQAIGHEMMGTMRGAKY